MRSRNRPGAVEGGAPVESHAETHVFVEGPPLLIRGDMEAGRVFDRLGAAMKELGLSCRLTMQGLRIEPLSGTSARTN